MGKGKIIFGDVAELLKQSIPITYTFSYKLNTMNLDFLLLVVKEFQYAISICLRGYN